MTKKHWTAIAEAIARTNISHTDKVALAENIAEAIGPEIKGAFDKRTFLALATYNG